MQLLYSNKSEKVQTENCTQSKKVKSSSLQDISTSLFVKRTYIKNNENNFIEPRGKFICLT